MLQIAQCHIAVIFVGNKPCSDATCLACLSNLEERSLMRWSRKGIVTVRLKFCSTESDSGFERCRCTRVTRGLATAIPECSAIKSGAVLEDSVCIVIYICS